MTGAAPDAAGARFDEPRRKLVHVGMLGFALLLPWLAWWQAALCAAAALGYNALLFRRLHGVALFREQERARRFGGGILLYPLAVLGLVLAFRHELVVAGMAWAVLALGDGAATLVGRRLGRRRLPWNQAKSWAGTLAFVAAALPGALALGWYLRHETASGEAVPLARLAAGAALAALLGALVESLDLGVDDNLAVPAAAGLASWVALHASSAAIASGALPRALAVGLGVSLALGLASLALRGVDRSGFLAGLAIGTAVWAGAGWRGYLVLLAFFVLGVAATRLGYRDKARRGLAEGRGGRRGAGSVVAKGAVGAAAALAIPLFPARAELLFVAFLGAFAAATADTVSSEVGKRYGRRAVSPVSLAPRPPGSEGAISLEGTAAGALAGLAVGLVPVALGASWRLAPVVGLAALAANHLESVAGALLGRLDARGNELLNVLVTLAGAALAAALASAALR